MTLPRLFRTLLAMIFTLVAVGHARAAEPRESKLSVSGTWVLDSARSQDYLALAKDANEKLDQLRRERMRKNRTMEDTKRRESRGQFFSQQQATLDQMNEDARVDIWDVDGDLRTLVTAASIKIYQARMCALLYDRKFKRLVAINPHGNSFSALGNEIAHDDLGRSVSYVEGGALVVDTDMPTGDRLSERFRPVADGQELEVVTRLRRSRIDRAIEFTRVYTRGE